MILSALTANPRFIYQTATATRTLSVWCHPHPTAIMDMSETGHPSGGVAWQPYEVVAKRTENRAPNFPTLEPVPSEV